jgi:hypothetical protein
MSSIGCLPLAYHSSRAVDAEVQLLWCWLLVD